MRLLKFILGVAVAAIVVGVIDGVLGIPYDQPNIVAGTLHRFIFILFGAWSYHLATKVKKK